MIYVIFLHNLTKEQLEWITQQKQDSLNKIIIGRCQITKKIQTTKNLTSFVKWSFDACKTVILKCETRYKLQKHQFNSYLMIRMNCNKDMGHQLRKEEKIIQEPSLMWIWNWFKHCMSSSNRMNKVCKTLILKCQVIHYAYLRCCTYESLTFNNMLQQSHETLLLIKIKIYVLFNDDNKVPTKICLSSLLQDVHCSQD